MTLCRWSTVSFRVHNVARLCTDNVRQLIFSKQRHTCRWTKQVQYLLKRSSFSQYTHPRHIRRLLHGILQCFRRSASFEIVITSVILFVECLDRLQKSFVINSATYCNCVWFWRMSPRSCAMRPSPVLLLHVTSGVRLNQFRIRCNHPPLRYYVNKLQHSWCCTSFRRLWLMPRHLSIHVG